MADFSKYTNWTPETSFSEVVYGKDSPLLEVEMNEMQEIEQYKLKKITKAIGNCALVDSSFFSFISSVSGENVRVTGYNINGGELFTDDGRFITIPVYSKDNATSISYRIANASTEYVFAYIYNEEVVKDDSVLYKNGFLGIGSSGTPTTPQIENPIRDSRYDNETSRRKVVNFRVSWGLSIPSDTENYKVVLLGTITKAAGATTFVFTPASNSLSDARNSAIQSRINKENIDNIDSQILRSICSFKIGKDPWTGMDFTDPNVFCDYHVLNDGDDEQVYKATVPTSSLTKVISAYNRVSVYKSTGWETHQSQWTDLDKYMPVLMVSKGSFGLVIKKTLDDGAKYKLDYRINFHLGKITDDAGFEQEYDSFDSFKAISNTVYFTTDTPTNQYGEGTEIELPYTFLHFKTTASLFLISAMGITFYPYTLYKYNSTSHTWDLIVSEDADMPIDFIYIKHIEASIHRIGIDKVTRPTVDFNLLTQDYNSLSNKPQINSVTLSGNKTQEDLHIQGGSGEEMTAQEVEDTFNSIFNDEDSSENEEENTNE